MKSKDRPMHGLDSRRRAFLGVLHIAGFIHGVWQREFSLICRYNSPYMEKNELYVL